MSRSVFGRFAPRLQEAIATRLGWAALRPVQELAGAAILDGKNAVVLAPTAGGKTEASMFPALSLLVEHGADAVGVLYLAPLRALLNNQADRLGLYSEMVGLRRFVWHGDVDAAARRKFVAEPAELLMTTPESLEVMLASGRVPVPKLFGDLRLVVIDEVHALAGTDRGAHLMSVLERIAEHSRHDVQRVGLSATVGNPAAIVDWLRGTSRREGVVIDPPKEPRRRAISVVLQPDEPTVAVQAARMAAGKKCLFFCNSRRGAEGTAAQMRERGTEVFVHHGSVSRAERQRAEEAFHAAGAAAIVCTSTLELGIDIGDLDLVLQQDAPSTVSSFLQRMGRTGRREGSVANTTFFCEDVETVEQAIALVELAREGWVESITPQSRCWPVLVHQVLAFTLELGGVTRAEAWRRLARVPDLSGITRAEYDEVVDHMVGATYLFEADGQLAMGEAAERAYGRKNFFELYAVFTTPQHYRVLTAGGVEIGSLDHSFADSLVETMTAFLLAGRPWLVEKIDHEARTITATPAPHGKKPRWMSPRGSLGFDVCQRIRRVLAEDVAYAYLDASAAAALAGRRERFALLLADGRRPLQQDHRGWHWWTFAGGRINQTIRLALAALTGWTVSANNFHVSLPGDDVGEAALREALARLATPELWSDAGFWRRVLALVPPYRLSKFQRALPDRYQVELVGASVLDLAGARAFLAGGVPATAAPGEVDTVLRDAIAGLPASVPAAALPLACPEQPIRFIDHAAALVALCAELTDHPLIGLDVETTLADGTLCLVQLAVPGFTAVVDAIALDDLSPLGAILDDERLTKLAHNASFELAAFTGLGLPVRNLVDTLELSRKRRGREPDGHRLAAVCRRELGLNLDKTLQKSDWTRRPLTAAQLAYAALDAELLLRLYPLLTAPAAS